MGPAGGTLTLLFTDIEGSTNLARALGDAWGDVLAAHRAIVGGAIAAEGGQVDGTEGDAFFALFADAAAGVRAAVAAQRALRAHPWPAAVGGSLRVRMGLHAGRVERREGGYVGLEVHRAARVAGAAHGGQVLLTLPVLALAPDAVPVDDLGRHRLKDFPAPEQLYCAVIDGEGAAAFPPPRALSVRPTNLPADDRPLFGRAADLEAIVAAFAEERERLVTLTGLGGTGKTRLALAAGPALLDVHPGGVWWVGLAGVGDEGDVVPAVAAALGAAGSRADPVAAIADRIGDRPTLLVLDNLEHLTGAAALVGDLLARAPALRVLATSQAPLRLGAERVLALGPLDPLASRELFARVAARVRPGWTASTEDVVLIDELAERLDHLPLALELAAARLRVLALPQLVERLRGSTAVVAGGARDAPERQRSLRATIEWTLGLLEPEPRALFTRLGVFAGAVELDDVEAVCARDDVDVLDATTVLLDVGLLRRREDGSGALRLRLPEAVRQFAAAELAAAADADRWRRRHLEHLVRVAVPAGTPMASRAADVQAADTLDAEAVAALEWGWDAEPSLAGRLAAARAGRLSEAGRVREARELADRVLAASDADDAARALALSAWGQSEMVLSHADEAVRYSERALELDPGPSRLSVYVSTVIALSRGMLGGGGDWRAAHARAIRDAEALGDDAALAGALLVASQSMIAEGALDEGAAALERAARLAAAAGAKCAWHVDTVRADLALLGGRLDDAAADYLRSGAAAEIRGDTLQVLFDVLGVAAALATGGRDEAAAELHGLARAIGDELGRGVGTTWLEVPGQEQVARALERLGPEAAEAAVARGRASPAGRRLARARELAG